MADGCVPVVLSPEPFARTTTYVEAPAGCTVRTMLTSAVARGHLKLDDLARTNIYVDGVRLDRDNALTMVLREGQVINVVVEPLGGGGGGKKDVGQILLTIAVIAVSMWVGGPAGPLNAWPMLARQVAAAAVLTAGQMAIAAIFKPETNVAKANDRYALSSASNQYRQWGSMPLALGEVVVAPDLAVKTFTQAHGEDQWIYGILGLHYGPCTAEDLKIGDTLVSSMGAGDVRVAYHLTPGPRTFSIVANDTDQLDLQEELPGPQDGSTPVVRAASAEGEQFEFDFFMPQGLYFAKDDGRKLAASMTVSIRYRPIDQNGVPTGAGAWANGLTIPLTSSSSDPWRFTRSISLPLGRYEFEVRRSPSEDPNPKRRCDIGWTAIRAIAFRKPVVDETLSLIEFAVRASALNQGNLAPFTCRITPICETWTGSAWGPPAPTSNPAAVTRWLMTGPAPALPLSSTQADVGLRTWAALCDQYDWKAHIYLTEDRKQDAVLQLLGMNGRASLFWDGTQLVASTWTEKPAPRQLFAGSNLKDHRWEIVFPDPVHALRVEFQNIDQGGEADEVYVYADGYGETADPTNDIEAATLVEALRLEGQQTIERAYRDGRWNLAARLHQRRVDSWSTDIEHIVCRYGDRVRLAWDRVGTANATVRNRVWSGGLVSGLRLSQPVRMEPGRAYALDLRLPDQVLTGVPVVNPATTEPVVTRIVSFADLRNPNVSPRGGDLIAFGEPERISEDVEVIGITPGPDLTATLVGIRYVAPLLMAAETGPIPPLQSRLTRERSMDPPTPTLLGWQADAEGVRIGFSMPPWRGSPVTGFTVRWRQTPAAGQSSAWVSLPDLPANAMTAVLPPLRELPADASDVTSAQVQIVAVTADGRVSVQPLQVTVYEQAIQKPLAGDWSVTELTQAPDGSRQSGFLVIGLVGSVNPRRVTVEYGASEDGPWDSAFDGAPVEGVVRAPILGMQPGAECWIAITYWTAQGAAPSDRGVMGPFTAPELIAGDLSPESPVRIAVTEITDRLQGVEQVSAANAAAVADLEEVYGDTASSAAIAAQVAADKAAVIQAKADAIIAKDGAVSARADAILAKADAIAAKQESVAASGASATSASQAGGFKTAAEAAAAVSTSQKQEAVAALNAMGRQNLVARENVTNPADLFSVTTGGTSGWGFSMAGSGANVTRSIKVGPLKVNTAYSISFKARRTSGSGSLLLDVDLFPDTLPGRTFDIQSSALTEFKWENITSASADMALSTVMLRFFRAPLPAGYAYEITDIKLEEGATATAWTPSPKDAATSAKAAAQSASQAFASETAAGQQASAASQDRQAAQTARGEAQGFRDQSSAAASTASGAAATATEQAGLAATARGEAQGFAGSALEYRNQASSFKTAAEAAAAVATSQKLEAVAALNAMGRQNLVARQNVTAGQAVAFGAGSLSGWGFSMVGTGTGSQERSITVGPLKRNTAYSVSILARRLAGSGSAPITCDFSPYLPERTFDIQANAWTRFTWENITSASADMELSTVRLRFFRPNMAAGLNVEITDIKLEEGATATAWTPSAKDAPYSAAAAATSAASAAASETASGQNASATQADRIAAQTARGQAEGFRNQAVQASEDATAQASIATAQAGLSSGSATLAGQKADAAAGSAALASTKADEAGASAAASRADQISASAARDQALAALMAQGRQNLVARQNVPTAQAVTFGAGSLSGWGFSMVGTGSGSQERSITVGPLKRNTAYSVSILARRLAGSGSAPITCDFFPDTLPERTFDVQANAWTRFTWENITSASADMELSTVRLRFFRPNMAAGLNVEITDIKLEEGATATAWTPSAKDAPYSASAAATSAASAAASDTAAGQKAAAAEGSATTAATRAGEALTYRNQASSAASDAAGYAATASLASGTSVSARDQSVAAKDQAVGAKEDAQAAAATAIQQKSEATAAAAAASISANLAASVSASRNQLLYNSTGARGMDGWVGGPNWSTQDFGYGFGRGFNCAVSGSYLYNDNAHFAEIAPESWVTWSADPKIFGGTCDIWFEFYDSSFNRVGGNYAGRQVANRDFGDTVSGEALAPANAFNARLVIWPNFSTGGSAGVRRMKVERGRLPATAWSDEGTTEALAASLSVTAAVAADAQTRLANVIFEVIGASGGDPFQLLFRTQGSNSYGRLVASALSLCNVIGGQVVEVLKLVGGNVFITGVLVCGTPGGGRVEINGPAMRIDVYDDQNRLRGRFGKLS